MYYIASNGMEEYLGIKNDLRAQILIKLLLLMPIF